MGGTPVSLLIAQALPATLLLAFASLITSIVLSVPLGIYAAVNRGRWPDQVDPHPVAGGPVLPEFLARHHDGAAVLHRARHAAAERHGGARELRHAGAHHGDHPHRHQCAPRAHLHAGDALAAIHHGRALEGPAATASCSTSTLCATRAIPLVTYIGLQFGGLIGGIVIVERVFNWPGMGTLAFDAISARDYPVLQGTITVLALFIVLINLLVDIAYGLIDPRIRTE